jgi:hypothetical protein
MVHPSAVLEKPFWSTEAGENRFALGFVVNNKLLADMLAFRTTTKSQRPRRKRCHFGGILDQRYCPGRVTCCNRPKFDFYATIEKSTTPADSDKPTNLRRRRYPSKACGVSSSRIAGPRNVWWQTKTSCLVVLQVLTENSSCTQIRCCLF